jgi:hypothetical protein
MNIFLLFIPGKLIVTSQATRQGRPAANVSTQLDNDCRFYSEYLRTKDGFTTADKIPNQVDLICRNYLHRN